MDVCENTRIAGINDAGQCGTNFHPIAGAAYLQAVVGKIVNREKSGQTAPYSERPYRVWWS